MHNGKTYVFSGRFDPPTIAHQTIISYLDRISTVDDTVVIAVETAKDENTLISHRIEMVKMIAPRATVLAKSTPMYSFLRDNKWFNNDTVLVLGMEEWNSIMVGGHWHMSQDLLDRCEFLVFSQHTCTQNEPTTAEAKRCVDSGRVTFAEMSVPAVASLSIRKEFMFNPIAAPIGVPVNVLYYIKENKLYDQLGHEAALLKEAKYASNQYDSSEYPKPSVTATVLIHNESDILLVRRKSHPYKGFWAFPGGFANPHEDIEDVGLRELKEETGISKDMLEANGIHKVMQLGVFTPNDPRFNSKTSNTWAYDVGLEISLHKNMSIELHPHDDATDAKWVRISEISDGKLPLAFHHRVIFDRFHKLLQERKLNDLVHAKQFRRVWL